MLVDIFRWNMAQLNPQLQSLWSEMIKDRMGLWATWSHGRCSCPWQGRGNKIQPKPFSDSSGLMTINHMGHFSFPSLFNMDVSLKTVCPLSALNKTWQIQTGQAPPKHSQESSRTPLTSLLGVQRDNPPQASSKLGGAIQKLNPSAPFTCLQDSHRSTTSIHEKLSRRGALNSRGLTQLHHLNLLTADRERNAMERMPAQTQQAGRSSAAFSH